jgi:hypothetical protein
MKKKTPVQGDDDATFMHDMGIKGIRVVHTESSLNMKGGSLPPTSSVNIGCKIGGNPKEKTLLVNAICEVVSFYDDDASNPGLKIHCEYQVIYEFPDHQFPTVSQVKLRQIDLQTTAMIQLWPFIRHYVYWISSQMQIPPITIPPYNFSLMANVVTPQLSEQVKPRKRKQKAGSK